MNTRRERRNDVGFLFLSLALVWLAGFWTAKAVSIDPSHRYYQDAMRSPDVSWVRNERLEAISDEEWEKFLPLCPDFVLELRSPSDPLRVVQKKMEEYMGNGARLGWLLDPARRQVHLYRPRARPQVLENPENLPGEPVLNRFVLDVRQVWAAMARRK